MAAVPSVGEFGFPFAPYAIQGELMRALYAAIDERRIAIFESPTGTVRLALALCDANCECECACV